MNINRNNYEEYFLLYADKELYADEKNMVEIFVKQNPDLEEEFIMLQQSVVKPDVAISLENKSSLFKKEEFININNYEEKFLLYTDNELNLSEIEETEKFVLSNSTLQKEFTLLQQVKYKADTSIVFQNKNSLYKKEEYAKVISVAWKAMAAAILLGLGLWLGISHLQKNKTEPDIVSKQNIGRKDNGIKPVDQQNTANDIPLVENHDNQNMLPQKAVKKRFNNSIQKQAALPQHNVPVKNIQSFNKSEVNKITENKNEDVVLNNTLEKHEVIKTNDLMQPSKIVSEAENKIAANSSTIKNNYIKPASYISDAEIKKENYVFYNITAEEFRKSKVGNFLKKVKRVIERKISSKDNSFNQ